MWQCCKNSRQMHNSALRRWKSHSLEGGCTRTTARAARWRQCQKSHSRQWSQTCWPVSEVKRQRAVQATRHNQRGKGKEPEMVNRVWGVGMPDTQALIKTQHWMPPVTNAVGMDSVDIIAYPKLWQHQYERWKRLQGKEILFKMDTDANVIVISKKEYHIGNVKLEKPSRILHGPACQPLEILGQFTGSLRLLHKDHLHVEDFFVVWDQHNNLLGWQQS